MWYGQEKSIRHFHCVWINLFMISFAIFCEKTGHMKTVAVERALLMYMESYEQNIREVFGGRKDEGK